MALHLDIREAIAKKAPNAKVPGFIVRYLERIAHVAEMNRRFELADGLEGVDFIRNILSEEFNITVDISGTEHIPTDDKPLIFVSNHPLGAIDGVIELMLIQEVRQRPIKAIVNDILMNVTPLTGLFEPISKTGGQNREYALRHQAMWESGIDVLSFPAGVCSRKQHLWSEPHDLEWQKSVVQKARQYGRDIVPLHFIGQNSNWFYNLSWWRKKLGIRFNIEMMYLVDELYKAKGKHFEVRVGEPIKVSELNDGRAPKVWAQELKERVYKI